jgi:hypothetical protein
VKEKVLWIFPIWTLVFALTACARERSLLRGVRHWSLAAQGAICQEVFQFVAEYAQTSGRTQERDADVLVTIRHEPLASPEQTIMKFLETHSTIRNKEAREITHIRDSDKMKRILSTMADKGEIEGVPGAQFGGMKYRKKQKD